MTTNKRLPNHSLDKPLGNAQEFTNYNNTIIGYYLGSHYFVQHWSTTMFEIDPISGEIINFELDYISQTSSTLVGRILRSKLVTPASLRKYVLDNKNSLQPKTVKNYLAWCDRVESHQHHKVVY